MPNITEHQSSSTTKILLIGDSGTGKTGALASLAAAGFKLRILDLDNGIEILKNYLIDPKSPYVVQNPKVAEGVRYKTLTDPMKNIAGRLIPSRVTVWRQTMESLIHWKEEDGTDLGKITDWDTETILVIDSLSALSEAALNFHLSMNAGLGNPRTQNEARRDVGSAQNLLRQFLQLIKDDSIKCNVILTAHITFVNEVGEKPGGEGSSALGTGYPAAIGRALSPHVPRGFNAMLICKSAGSGSAAKQRIYTRSQNVGGMVVSGKNPAPLRVATEYPIETGLADYFRDVRGERTS